MPATSNGWGEYQRLVLSELKRLDEDIRELSTKVDLIKSDITMLKVKAGAWGALGAMVPVSVALVVYLITRH